MGPDAGRTGNTVENYGWGKEAAIEKWLFAEGHRFDFFQAVRLLEMIQAANGRLHSAEEAGRNGGTPYAEPGVSPGEGADPSKETVHFKSAVSLDFPSSDIAGVSSGNGAEGAPEMVAHFKTGKLPAEMTVNFLGLAGCLGALDTPTTELILQRTSRNDVALR
ncbi:MAG TPA: type VI secretion system baseplate subunit TssG, partial [Pyrinomonadaceae bacterium]|nr:type VI secretion system baseplate subunit TssG [Pyrinomonadaceae bacterium]